MRRAPRSANRSLPAKGGLMALGVAAGQTREPEPLVGRPTRSIRSSGCSMTRARASGCNRTGGRAGIGKTRVLAELASRCELRGHLVLSGSASELERELRSRSSYMRSMSTSRASIPTYPPPSTTTYKRSSRTSPSLSALADGRAVAPQHERYRSHRAVRALLERLAQTRPLVLVLDDFHWADSASVELLARLLRRPPAAAVLTAVALRPANAERLAAALERADRAAALTRVELDDLTPDEARELLGERVSAADAAVLYEECGGNPFLEQLARSLERAGRAASAPESSPTSLEVPQAVAASLNEKSHRCRTAAVSCWKERRWRATHSNLSWRLRPRRGCGDGRSRRAPAGRSHPHDRRASTFPSTPARPARCLRDHYRRLATAHERCAEALAVRGATAAARAHHVERSARQGDAAAVAVLCEAGESAARLAPISAARWFAGALRLPRRRPLRTTASSFSSPAPGRYRRLGISKGHDALQEAVAIVPDNRERPLHDSGDDVRCHRASARAIRAGPRAPGELFATSRSRPRSSPSSC